MISHVLDLITGDCESQKGKILNEEEYLHELIQGTLQMKQNKRTYFVVTQLDCASTLVILFLLSKKKGISNAKQPGKLKLTI